MPNYANKTICFADIVDSTRLTNELGSEEYSKYRVEFTRLCSSMIAHFKGTHVKDNGDCVFSSFDDVKNAVAFACNIQFFYKHFCSKSTSPIKIRIGIVSGLVEMEENDFQGASVNLASRLEGIASPGEIAINQDIFESLKKIFGESEAQLLVKNKEKVTPKGFDTPIDYYTVQNEYFFTRNPDMSFYSLAMKYMQSLGVNFSNITTAELNTQGELIFPIVPRAKVNLVHCGLLEIARVFSVIGWGVHILLADFGKDNLTETDVSAFECNLKSALDKRKIANYSITVLSALIAKGENGSCCSITHDHLYPYLSKIKASEMIDILGKQYSSSERIDFEKSSLNTLRPVFTLAGVQYILNNKNFKCLVLSGDDERMMWSQCIKLDNNKKLGAVHIPMITNQSGHQFNQNRSDLFWVSQADVLDNLTDTNIAEWTASQIIGMEKFPCERVLPYKEDERKELVLSDVDLADIIIKRLTL